MRTLSPTKILALANAAADRDDHSTARFHAWSALSAAGIWQDVKKTINLHEHGAILRVANERLS